MFSVRYELGYYIVSKSLVLSKVDVPCLMPPVTKTSLSRPRFDPMSVHVGVIVEFHRDVKEICALLGCYAAYSGSYLPTFRHNIPVPSSRVKEFLEGGRFES